MFVPAGGDSKGALEDHSNDRRAHHVLEVLREEAFVRDVLVMLREHFLARPPHAARD